MMTGSTSPSPQLDVETVASTRDTSLLALQKIAINLRACGFDVAFRRREGVTELVTSELPRVQNFLRSVGA